MSSASDDEPDVKLYNSLERNRKRQRVFVSLSSSESDSDDDNNDDNVYDDGRSASSASPYKKRLRGSSVGTASPASGVASGAARTVVLDDEEDDEYGDNLLTAKEREMERERERRLDMEIAERIAKDALLNQTRAIMSKVKLQMAVESSNSGIIALDSDEEEDDDAVAIVPPTAGQASNTQAKSSPVSSTSASGPSASGETQLRGDRLTLQVRSNGERTDELVMFSKEPFSVLYERFCNLHGLPRSAVQMSLDGESLKSTDTPDKSDLESGDLIDAKVDFSKADTEKKKRVVRLLLVVEGRKPEKFRIDATSALEKLHLGFCKRHQIADPDDVEMTIRGDRVRLSETVEAHELYDNDVINVEIKNFVDPTSIELSVRYDAKTTRPHTVIPTQKVESLIAQIAEHLSVDAGRISLRVDGEGMVPSQTLQYYDLEGGEIIEVKVQS